MNTPKTLQPLSSITDRFWSNVNRLASHECWEWTGYRMRSGYGLFQARKVSKIPLYSHRVAWELSKGEIPNGLHVCHHCDNPPCCNPAHMFLGTQRDNSIDRTIKGRTASADRNGARTKPQRNPFVKNGGSGLTNESHPCHVLSNQNVESIRLLFATGKYTHVALAERFGVSGTHIGRIIKNKSRNMNA